MSSAPSAPCAAQHRAEGCAGWQLVWVCISDPLPVRVHRYPTTLVYPTPKLGTRYISTPLPDPLHTHGGEEGPGVHPGGQSPTRPGLTHHPGWVPEVVLGDPYPTPQAPRVVRPGYGVHPPGCSAVWKDCIRPRVRVRVTVRVGLSSGWGRPQQQAA